MTDNKEYRVISKEGIDIAELEFELERDTTNDTSDSTTHIPNRIVDVLHAKKFNNRITHYTLSDEEATELSKDPRILAVLPKAKPFVLAATQTNNFSRSDTAYDQTPWPNTNFNGCNWGLKRHTEQSYEFISGAHGSIEPEESPNRPGDYNYTLDGTGVDIVIMDNGVDPWHSQFHDADGNSRHIQFDWNQIIPGIITTDIPTYYGIDPDGTTNLPAAFGNHGTGCAAVAAGNHYGWAKNAHIYSVNILKPNIELAEPAFTEQTFDLIKKWHERKNDPNDSLYTGRPTIVNQSFYIVPEQYTLHAGNGRHLTEFYWKGTQVLPEGTTIASLGTGEGQTDGVPYGLVGSIFGGIDIGYNIEQKLLTDAGVICVRAAGNFHHPMAGPPGSPYYDVRLSDNAFVSENIDGTSEPPSSGKVYYNRVSTPESDDTLFVAGLDHNVYVNEDGERQEFMWRDSERGPRIDIIAAGDRISAAVSSSHTGKTTTDLDGTAPVHYQVRGSGTSFAAPQITGMGALWLQMNPKGTAQQFKDFLTEHASTNSVVYDSIDEGGTLTEFGFNKNNLIPRLYGAPNKIAYWPYNSPEPWNID
jgi:hypothetical protein